LLEQTRFFLPSGTADQAGKLVARMHTLFDEQQRVREVIYRDDSGQPVRTPDGYARFTVAYDSKGRPTGHTYYDQDGKQVSTRVVVVRVAPGSQGQRLGLLPGDILLRYDGQPVTQTDAFIRGRQAESKTDRPRPLVVRRKDRTFTIQVSPGLLGVNMKD